MGDFTIRVYGLLVQEDQILLSRENIKGGIYTKFPGGGLEFGEGIIDCLKREFMEEAQITLSDTRFLYINEDFVPSAFHDKKQLISIYYLVKSEETEKILTGNPDDTKLLQSDGDQVLYWCPVTKIREQPIELAVDKVVAHKILE